MRIGIVGGLTRAGSHYCRLAASAGHELLFHDGWMGGRGVKSLEHLVERSDVVVVVTDVNSHGAVQLARSRLRAGGRSPVLLRRCGLARFGALLAELEPAPTGARACIAVRRARAHEAPAWVNAG